MRQRELERNRFGGKRNAFVNNESSDDEGDHEDVEDFDDEDAEDFDDEDAAEYQYLWAENIRDLSAN